MKTITDVKGRCRIDDEGHWIWTGANIDGKHPRVVGPDHTRGGTYTQTGKRAVWHMVKGRPIPAGWRVYSTCNVPLCLNPNHIACGPGTEVGQHWRETGVHKNSIAHKLANRKTSRARSTLTDEKAAEILASNESGAALCRRLGVSRNQVDKLRRGRPQAIQPLGGLFSGLLAANDRGVRRA